jgi:hypothetical protein
MLIAREPLLAFGFSNLAMLGWLAAAAAPLLIHLWSRHRFREAPWAAMQFLLAALRKNSRRLQLQQWILLALRTLLIALVVLAVAEPYGEQLVAGSAGSPVHALLVIDGSNSMAYRSNDSSCFGRAKRLAAELVNSSRAGDVFTVIVMGSPAETIVGRETVTRADIVAQIEALTQKHTQADIWSALGLVDVALAEAAKDQRAPKRQEIYFFTDLQRSTWQSGGSVSREKDVRPSNNRSVESDTINNQLVALTKRAAVTMVDVGEADAANLAVTRLASSVPFLTVGSEVGIEVSLKQFGTVPRPQCNVELLIDEVPVGQQTVEVPAAGEVSVPFSHRFSSSGDHTIAVRAAADRLPTDDTRWLIAPVRAEIRVLCVAGRDDAAKYVADALNPNPEIPSAIRTTIISDGQLVDLELADFDCIFLCNVAQLTSTEAQRLTRYVASGGGVVMFLGDRVLPTSYNEFAAGGSAGLSSPPPSSQHPEPQTRGSLTVDPSHASDPRLLPARIGDPVSPTQFGVDPLDYRHAIVAPFRGREGAGLLTTPISRYFRLDLSGSPRGVQVAAATPSGDPLIVTAPLGRGRTALVATDGSLSSIDATTGESWTLWPTWPSFLPIVRELMAYAGGGEDRALEQLAGSSLYGLLPVGQPNDPEGHQLRVIHPDGGTSATSVHTTAEGLEWTFDDTSVSGIYSLIGLPNSNVRSFAVNVDTRESDLTRIDKQDLPPGIVVRTTAGDGTDADSGDTQFSRAGWSGTLLAAAFAIMLLESFLAWHFGRGGA